MYASLVEYALVPVEIFSRGFDILMCIFENLDFTSPALPNHILPPQHFAMGKKNGSFGRDYGKVVGGNNAKDFPGWKGPAYVKKADPRASSKSKAPVPVEEENEEPEPSVPVELQQNLLNIFRDTFPELLDSNELKPTLQEVKNALYERDFNRAFGKEEFLEAYSVRWSPSRALCYNTILVDIKDHLRDLEGKKAKAKESDERSTLSVVSFGGGAAEVVAFGGYVRYLLDATSEENESEKADPSEALANLSISEGEPEVLSASETSASSVVDALLIDCAEWQQVVEKLHTGLLTPPIMSKYASTAAKAANKSMLISGHQATKFSVEDCLTMDQTKMAEIIGQKPKLVTLLFTLNELYTSSIPKTTAFLLKLTIAAKPGTLLLVVDSPGSYSETTMGTEAKKYPMHWLLNHTLVDTAKINGVANKPDWEKVVSDESRWFRVPDSLRYPISLENMRYQIHLYRRV